MARADTMAQRLLAEFGITRPPVDPEKIAQDLGAPVVYRTMTPDVSGMLIRESSGSIVVVNQDHYPVRQRFTMGHELGHLCLHPGRPLIVDAAVLVNLRDQVSSLATDREEIEANRFAAVLLMPEAMVRSELERLGLIDPDKITKRLAKTFDVSEAAMTIRLTNLGLFGLA
jgi:Zn-dependent peptidase ImmA (M78 family)